MRIVLPPQQDEANALTKKLYYCEARGCGWIGDRKAIYCKDHATAEQRKECEAEYDARINAPHPSKIAA